MARVLSPRWFTNGLYFTAHGKTKRNYGLSYKLGLNHKPAHFRGLSGHNFYCFAPYSSNDGVRADCLRPTSKQHCHFENRNRGTARQADEAKDSFGENACYPCCHFSNLLYSSRDTDVVMGIRKL